MITLKSFFVFNSDFCLEEGEEEKKIFYYHPSSDQLDTKIRNVGLVEAVIKFTESFRPEKKCHSLHTQKTRQIYLQVEGEFWFVLVLNVPRKKASETTADANDYKSEDIQDSVYISVLEQLFARFKLLNGSVLDLIAKTNAGELRSVFGDFFDENIPSLSIDNCNFFNMLKAIKYLKVTSSIFLEALCLTNEIKNKHDYIAHTAYLFDDEVVWSSVEPENFQALYRYVVEIILPTNIQFKQKNTENKLFGKFLSNNTDTTPVVYLRQDGELKAYRLLVYNELQSTLLLLFHEQYDFNDTFLNQLSMDLYCGVTSMAPSIRSYKRLKPALTDKEYQNNPENSMKYICFNKLNLGFISNSPSAGLKMCDSLPHDVSMTITEFRNSKMDNEFYGEIVAKMLDDYWVVAKFSNHRELYVVINNHKAQLIFVNDEVRKICDTDLKQIFFQQ